MQARRADMMNLLGSSTCACERSLLLGYDATEAHIMYLCYTNMQFPALGRLELRRIRQVS